MKKNSRFMTSTEKKIARKNGAIRFLVVLLIISIIINIFSVKYIFSIKNSQQESSDGFIEKVVSSDEEAENSETATVEENGKDNEVEDVVDNVAEEQPVDEEKNKSENRLSEKTEIYDLLYKQIVDGKTSVTFSFDQNKITYEDIYNEYSKILDEHPEIFWLSGGANSSGTLYNGEATYTINLLTSCDMAEVDAMRDELEDVVSRVVLEAKENEKQYDQVKYVHDYMVKECDYDMVSYNKTLSEGDDAVDGIIYTAYGCLINKKAVCGGYAKAFQLLMNRFGVECGYVSGIGVNSLANGPHAWNYVCIDEKYYYVDVTWDDPVYDVGVEKTDTIRYDYFCISLDEMSKDHFADDGEYLPQ